MAEPSKGVRDLTQGPVRATLMAFALPTLGASVLQALCGTINTIWVGRFLGEAALAATVNGNMISFLMVALVFGTGMSATVLVGKAVGARDLVEARRVMGTAIGAFAVIALVVAVAGWFAAPQILRLLGTPPQSAGLALDYLRITFIGLPAVLLANLLMMGLRGAGDALSPMWFTGFSAILDLILNPVLILGLGPAPRLGVAGAALAFTIAEVVTLAAVLVWIYARDLPIRLRGHEFGYLRPKARLLGEIIGKGLPMGLQMITVSVSAMAVMGLVNRQGVLTTAAYGVAQQLWSYLQMPAMAVAAAVSAMTAQAVGARLWSRMHEIARWGVVIGMALTAALVVLLLVSDHLVIGLFLGGRSLAGPIAEHILACANWGFVLMAASSVLFGALRADGVVIRPLLVTIAAMLVLRLGVAFGAYDALGAQALWLSLPAAHVCACLLAIGLYRHERRGRQRQRAMADDDLVEGEPLPAILP
ncbi:MATE family efflux transporter [Caulobacter sp.]|uniref:MATE family efflux transporter n=1 Tax=Caulobacter sp. TaxID=78 RepID=UPI0031D408A3